MKLRISVALGLAIVAASSLTTAAITKTWDDNAQLARHRDARATRVLPRARPAPTPTTDLDTSHQRGSKEGEGSTTGPLTKTEHHEVHGSGSITVVSGAVDPGTGGSDAQGSYVGPPRPPRAPRR